MRKASFPTLSDTRRQESVTSKERFNMIHLFIELLIDLLQESFGPPQPDADPVIPEDNIQPGPIEMPEGNEMPAIAIHTGDLEFDRDFTDVDSSDPRTEEISRSLNVNIAAPQGPYGLDPIPMQGTMLVRAVYHPDTANERRQLLLENQDYTVDYTLASMSFSFDLAEAARLDLTYKIPSIFTFRSFEQEFFVIVYVNDRGELERLTSLAASVILTRYNGLLEDYNDAQGNSYAIPGYQSRHRISSLHLLSCSPDHSFNHLFRLTFKVRGTLRLSRILDEPVGTIEKIFSPGNEDSDLPVDIDAELG